MEIIKFKIIKRKIKYWLRGRDNREENRKLKRYIVQIEFTLLLCKQNLHKLKN